MAYYLGREFYKALKAEGHDTYIVAPVQQQSGQGGRTIFASEAALSAPGQYDSVPAGAPSVGIEKCNILIDSRSSDVTDIVRVLVWIGPCRLSYLVLQWHACSRNFLRFGLSS